MAVENEVDLKPVADVQPSVIFASCCSQDATLIVDKLLNGLPSSFYEEDDFKCFPWRIDHKYYEADVDVIVLKRKILISVHRASMVQGIVLQFDSYDKNALHNIKSWNAFLQPYDAFNKILLCTTIDDDDPMCLKRLDVQKWCLMHGFELVELEPKTEIWEEEHHFYESTGILRVKQALEAHIWPNISPKARTIPKCMEDLWHGGTIPCAVTDCLAETVLPEQK